MLKIITLAEVNCSWVKMCSHVEDYNTGRGQMFMGLDVFSC